MLTAETIESNFNKFNSRIEKCFPTRAESLKKMYSELGEDRVCFAPASSTDYFHNAFPGGYVDHILRVMNFSIKTLELWETMGLDTSNFSKEELLFVAMHHDLGKLGLPGEGKELYTKNTSDWHVKNQGRIFSVNENIPSMPIQDRSLYLLQSFGIQCSFNEWLGIRIHDGMYDESNKSYLSNFTLGQRIRTDLIYIIHDADMMAARFEFERWNRINNRLNTNTIDSPIEVEPTPKAKKESTSQKVHDNLAKDFQNIFS